MAARAFRKPVNLREEGDLLKSDRFRALGKAYGKAKGAPQRVSADQSDRLWRHPPGYDPYAKRWRPAGNAGEWRGGRYLPEDTSNKKKK